MQALSDRPPSQAEPAAAVRAAGPGGGPTEGPAGDGGQDGGCECPPDASFLPSPPSCPPVTLFSLPTAARCPIQSIVSTIGPRWHPYPKGWHIWTPLTPCLFSLSVHPAEKEARGTSVSPRGRVLLGGGAGTKVWGMQGVHGESFMRKVSRNNRLKAQI